MKECLWERLDMIKYLASVHSGETTSLKKWDNTALQKPSNMLSYSVGHAAKIGAKKSYLKLLKKIDFSS